MWYVYSCSENWRTNIKFSRLTLYFYIPGHTWTDWKIGANHIFQKYKLDRKLLREIEGYFTVKLIVCLLRWCLLRIVTLPSWMRSTVEMFLAKIHISVPVFGLFLKPFTYFRNFWCQRTSMYVQGNEKIYASLYKFSVQTTKVNYKISKQTSGDESETRMCTSFLKQ